MSILSRHAAALALIAVTCRAQALSKLQITVQEGSGAVVPRSTLSSRSFTILISTADGRPLPGAMVKFRLPEQGPSGAFSSGLRSESLLTDERGQAHVRGILWGPEAGQLRIRVWASYDGIQAEASIPVEVSATAAPSAADRRSLSSGRHAASKRWLILAGAAGGAVAGVALAGGRSTSSGMGASTAAPVVAPTIGMPSITVGRP